jgi:uncharacterized low-complexity protein
MSKFNPVSSLGIVLGTIVATNTGLAQASSNPFGMSPLATGYTLAANESMEGKCGEAKCGAKAFVHMDSDKDGKITKAEFDTHKDAMFRKMDANGDGSISKDEMQAAMKARKHTEGTCGANKAQ